MKYPYIGKGDYSGAVFLFIRESTALTIQRGESLYSNYETHISEGLCTNITRDYLKNTYGEVVSPEHAEFIIELCLENSISFAADNARRKYFAINSGKLYFFCAEINASNIGSKKITIPLPLPPKQIQTATPEEEFEMTQIMKNAGDNLVLGCEDSKCDEWPCVGSVVTWGSKSVKGEVKALSDGLAWIKNEYGNYCSEYVSSLKKPKTPEEVLRDEIGVYLCEKYNFITGAESLEITETLLMKYNITKKPQ